MSKRENNSNIHQDTSDLTQAEIHQDTPTIRESDTTVISLIVGLHFEEIEYFMNKLYNHLIEYCQKKEIGIHCNHSKVAIINEKIELQSYGHKLRCPGRFYEKLDFTNNFLVQEDCVADISHSSVDLSVVTIECRSTEVKRVKNYFENIFSWDLTPNFDKEVIS